MFPCQQINAIMLHMNEPLTVLAALSAALIVARSKIFGFLPRNRLYFLRCLQCQGLWIGFSLGYWVPQDIKEAVIVGMIASGAGYTYNRIFPEITIRLEG